MKKRTKWLLAGTGSVLAGLVISLLIHTNLQKTYKVGEFDPSENAYFAGTIDDPAGLIKAHKFVTPTDNKYNSQKTRSLGTSLIGDIESTWSAYTGKGTTVAILDDGFDVDHPEFTRSDGTSAILSTSRYYYSNSQGTKYYFKEYSEEPSCIKEDWEQVDDNEYEWATHGTNTSSTAAAPMNNDGGVGIAPDADILALKVDFSFAALEGAIRYAVDQGVDVINMSLGAYAESFTDGWGESQSGYTSTATYLDDACQYAYNHGVIVVAAAGNESTWHKSYPACNYKVVGVGAIGDYDNKGNANKLAEFTNYVSSSQTGEINVDILAPGYVYTATQGTKKSQTSSSTAPDTHDHTWEDTQGTSFSCPIVAGAACLWKEKYPDGTPDEFLAQLQSTADGIGDYKNKMIPVSGWYSFLSDVGPSNIENGRLNVANLLDINEPYVNVSPNSYSISIGEKRQINITTSNGTITYSSSNSNVATVSNSGQIEGKGAGTATISVIATKNGHTASTPVTVSVNEAVAATSISFNPTDISLSVGETYNSEETLSVTPSNASRIFLFESEDESVATVDIDTGLVTAVGAGTTTINAIAGYGDGESSLTVTVTNAVTQDGTIEFGNATGKLNVNSSSVVGNDSLGNSWTVTTSGTTSFIQNQNYSQIGSSNNPASSITFEMTLSSSANFTSVSASFGGFNGSSAQVTIKVGSTTIGTGSVGSSTDSVTQNSSSASGTKLTISLNSISKGIKAYSISYTCNGSGGSSTPAVSSVSVSPSSLNLDLNGSTTGNLTATVTGTNSPAQTVNWSSGNTSIATVSSSGVVTAKAVGTTTITATSTVDSTKSGSATVTVVDTTPAAKTLSSISISGQKTEFVVGDAFVFGGIVTAHFSDSTEQNVTSSATFSGYNMSVAGNYTVTVSYTYATVNKTTSYQITVSAAQPSAISTYTIGWGAASGTTGTYSNFTDTSGSVSGLLSFSSAKNSSTSEPAYNSNNNELRLYYNSQGNGGSITITPEEGVTIKGFVMMTSTNPSVKYFVDGGSGTSISASNYTYTATNLTVSSSLKIQNVNTSNTQLRISTIALTLETADESDKIIGSLSASYSGGDIFVGGELDTSKISVTANFTDSSKYQSVVLASSDYSITGFSSATAGNKQVTITYTGSLQTSVSPLTTSVTVPVIEDYVTNVSVTNSKTYHPGESINKSEISVILTYLSGNSTSTTNFTFAEDGYMFTYSDAPSGGSSANKEFSITYNETVYNFTVKVSRTNYAPVNPDNMALTGTQGKSAGITGTGASAAANYSSLNINGITCAATNVYVYTQSNVDYFSFGKGEGEIHNTVALSKPIASLSIDERSGGRTDNSLYVSTDGSSWINYSSADLVNNDYRYFKVAYEGTSTLYSNFNNINLSLRNIDTAANVANYIMYTDTTNQCTSKLTTALSYFNNMSVSERNTFMNSEDYVISTARTRLLAWAAHEGKNIAYNNGDYIVSSAGNVLNSAIENNSLIYVFVGIFGGTVALGAFFLIRRKKHQ